jgi:hypothetical protein
MNTEINVNLLPIGVMPYVDTDFMRTLRLHFDRSISVILKALSKESLWPVVIIVVKVTIRQCFMRKVSNLRTIMDRRVRLMVA